MRMNVYVHLMLLSNLRAQVVWSQELIHRNLFASESATPPSDTADIKEDLAILEESQGTTELKALLRSNHLNRYADHGFGNRQKDHWRKMKSTKRSLFSFGLLAFSNINRKNHIHLSHLFHQAHSLSPWTESPRAYLSAYRNLFISY